MLDRAKHLARAIFEMFRVAANEYGEDRASRMAAAVAYRTIFALAPLLLVAVFVFGTVIDSDRGAQAEVLDAVEQFGGQTVADAMKDLLDSVVATRSTAGVASLALLLWTASSLFMEVQNDLNDIFAVPPEHTTGIVAFITKRGIGFLFALGLGVVLIAVWLLNVAWNLLGGLFPEDFAPVHELIGVLTPLVSLILLPLVIALSFQVMSRVRLRWRAVWWGSFFTSVAFLAAAYGTGLYFSEYGSSAAGVAGSIFVVVLLAFILSSVFFFGAEVTKIYNRHLNGGPFGKREDEDVPPAVVGEPEPISITALLAFLVGVLIGWRRSSRRQ